MECPHCRRQTSRESKTCRNCGRTIPPGQRYLEESGIVEPEVPIVREETAKRRRRVDDSDYELATLGDRFVAFTLDVLFLAVLFSLADAWAIMRWGSIDAMELRLSAGALLNVLLLNLTASFVYFWLLEAGFGATPGKVFAGIRVVRVIDRHPLSALAIRNALRILDGLCFYLVGALVASCSRARRRIGDVCAGTAVVKEEFGYLPKLGVLALVLTVAAGAVWSLPRICQKNLALRTPYLNDVMVRAGRNNRAAYLSIANLRIEVDTESSTKP